MTKFSSRLTDIAGSNKRIKKESLFPLVLEGVMNYCYTAMVDQGVFSSEEEEGLFHSAALSINSGQKPQLFDISDEDVESIKDDERLQWMKRIGQLESAAESARTLREFDILAPRLEEVLKERLQIPTDGSFEFSVSRYVQEHVRLSDSDELNEDSEKTEVKIIPFKLKD